jgi:metal transporter CNNM
VKELWLERKNRAETRVFRQQKKYAKKIIPIRKNGHLLLITLILANMIANETLPVIADKVFKGGIQAVVASTALIVM